MPLRKSKLTYWGVILILVIGTVTISEGQMPDNLQADSLKIISPDQDESADSLSSINSDKMVIGADSTLNSDSISPAPINLQPMLYQPGADSILINAFAQKQVSPDDSLGLDSAFSPMLASSSPTKALFKSVVVPGWGQFSNRKYFKAALILGLETYLIQKGINKGNQASDWKEKWQEAKASDDPLLAGMTSTYFANYSSYRNERNTQYWLLALTVFLSMFDAYVDAHLARFPDRVARPDELSLDLSFDDEVKTVLTYRF